MYTERGDADFPVWVSARASELLSTINQDNENRQFKSSSCNERFIISLGLQQKARLCMQELPTEAQRRP